MKIFAIADLHLSFGKPEKNMEVFGDKWKGYTQKIETNWKKKITNDDLVLVAGDISWSMNIDGALIDLLWIDQLPGKKVLIKGNHDYWWGSLKKVYDALPPSISVIQNNVFNYKNITIGGARLWDSDEYSFESYIQFVENPKEKKITIEESIHKDLQKQIFERELVRLRLSLEQLDPKADLRIAMTHYPPLGADQHESRVSKILEEFKIDICVFGHLHNIKEGIKLYEKKNKIAYYLTSCDYLGFDPIEVKPQRC